eukprot:12937307-Prorocentrum_lima.AAC.1
MYALWSKSVQAALADTSPPAFKAGKHDLGGQPLFKSRKLSTNWQSPIHKDQEVYFWQPIHARLSELCSLKTK